MCFFLPKKSQRKQGIAADDPATPWKALSIPIAELNCVRALNPQEVRPTDVISLIRREEVRLTKIFSEMIVHPGM